MNHFKIIKYRLLNFIEKPLRRFGFVRGSFFVELHDNMQLIGNFKVDNRLYSVEKTSNYIKEYKGTMHTISLHNKKGMEYFEFSKYTKGRASK